MSSIKPKKKNLFTFFKSQDFNGVRVLLCSQYILLTYCIELTDNINDKLKGYDGLFIGDLKHTAIELEKALKNYDKAYLDGIGDDHALLCDTTINVTTELDKTIEKNSYHLSQGAYALRAAIEKEIDDKVLDPDELAREASEDFEICSEEEKKRALDITLQMAKKRLSEIKDPLKGVEIGFTTAVNWINRIYKVK